MSDVHIIDCNIDLCPFPSLRIEPQDQIKSRVTGEYFLDTAKVGLYLSQEQKIENGVIRGYELWKDLKKKRVLSVNVLAYLLERPQLIPESWKGKVVFFWGTIYRDQSPIAFFRGRGGNAFVPYLYCYKDAWAYDLEFLGYFLFDMDTAAILID